VATTVVLLAPMGVVLGMAMPIGLTRLAAFHPSGVAWAWGVNGVLSVVGSVLAIMVAIVSGFAVATLVAMACYAVALASALLSSWPESARAWRPQPVEQPTPDLLRPSTEGVD
jgi:hypothetical protein